MTDWILDLYISRVSLVWGLLRQKGCWHVPEIFSNIHNSHTPLITSSCLQDDRMSVASSEKVLAFDKIQEKLEKLRENLRQAEAVQVKPKENILYLLKATAGISYSVMEKQLGNPA